MKIIRPTDITDAILYSSNVPETDYADYSGATTYALGTHVISTITHRIYESLQAGNVGNALTDPDWWLDVGATNRWRMFDRTVQAQTARADSIAVVLRAGRVDSLALLNIDAQTYRVTVHDNAESPPLLVYDSSTVALEEVQNIGNWYEYFFEPTPIRRTDVILTDLPPYTDGEISVTLSAPTATVKLGELIVGLYREIGDMQWAPRIGIIDYSKKEVDEFGNAKITERAFSKRMSCEVVIQNEFVDYVTRILSEYRATAVVWVGDGGFTTLYIFGFFRNFETVIESPAGSICNLEIEGLT